VIEASSSYVKDILTESQAQLSPVSSTRVDGPSTRLVETRASQHGPCCRVMETGHPSTRAVNSGSGNRALVTVTAH